MSWLDNWPIRKKLLSAFAVMALLTAGVGAIGVRNMDTLAGLTSSMYEVEATGLSVVKEANVGLVRTGRSLRGVLLAETNDVRSTMLASLEADLVNTALLLDSADALFNKPEGKALVASSKVQFAEYTELVRGVVQRADAEDMPGERTAVTYMRDTVSPKAAVLDSVLTELAQFKEANAAEASTSATAIYRTSRTAMLTFVAIALLIGGALGFLLANRLSGSIAAIVRAARSLREETVAPLGQLGSAIAAGDVQRTIAVKGQQLGFTRQDEIGEMARAFDEIVTEAAVTATALDEGRATIARMVTETQGLIAQASAGNLGDRAQAGNYRGSYAALVGSVNDLLDAMVGPMREVNAVLDRVASRDLSARVTAQYKGEFSAMADTLNLAANNLDDAMSQVAMASSQVASAGEQIAAGSQALASGASEQAASLEEISSSLNELSAMAGNSATLATQADSMSKRARTATSDGQAEMHKLATTMTEIRDAAHETSRIIKTIDEIAFQTNLLALNAAVEAARAGDAGRGFAVVADEVRALSIRAADAARSTTELIERSVTLAQSGVDANSIVSERLHAIDGSVTDVSRAMVEIATGAKQQADGVTQINKAVEQLNATTQQVAANAEESASASEELAGQALQLQALVGQFEISSVPSTSKLRTPVSVRPATAPRHARYATVSDSSGHSLGAAMSVADDEGMDLF